MNKYTELSDFEINKRVAARFYNNKDFIEAYKDVEKVFVDGNLFDPCNNPADAMPIIIENKICMNYIDNDIGWCAYHFDEGKGELEIYDKNYYRAAMTCFLIMKDAENEKIRPYLL